MQTGRATSSHLDPTLPPRFGVLQAKACTKRSEPVRYCAAITVTVVTPDSAWIMTVA